MSVKWGIRDVPIRSADEESLGLREYADALSDFVMKCETPLTIAIQGDWGSGKTSMMNLVRQIIDPPGVSQSRVQSIWFNTWQYSQFDLDGYLAVALITAFVDKLRPDANSDIKKRLAPLMNVGRALAIGAASVAGQGDAAKAALESLEDSSRIDAAMQVSRLKEKLEEVVDGVIGDPPKKERIVVFIDDLDRLVPERAVDFLEIFKLFLDIDNCVFVLACDYGVVMQGLKQKFGVSEEQLRGKNFFDKIIQLPFNMPIGLGEQRQKYISGLLDKIGIVWSHDDLAHYEELVEASVGFNPRSLKRIFNSLLLLKLVAERKGILPQPDDLVRMSNSDASTVSQKQKILFALLCLQMAFEPAYYYLINASPDEIDTDFFRSFGNHEQWAANPDDFGERYPHFAAIQKEFAVENDTGLAKMARLAGFMDVLYSCIQIEELGDKDNLLEEEHSMLMEVVNLSAVTATSSQPRSQDSTAGGRRERYLAFFEAFRDDLEGGGFAIGSRAKPTNSAIFATGNRRDYRLTFKPRDKVWLHMTSWNDAAWNKRAHNLLSRRAEEIDGKVGEHVIRHRDTNRGTLEMRVERDGSIRSGDEELDDLRRWAVDRAQKMFHAIEEVCDLTDAKWE